MARKPYTGATVSKFGPRVSPGGIGSTYHRGWDGHGGTIIAPESGVVQSFGYNGGWGNLIVFRGDSGTIHRLAHVAPGGLRAAVGTRVGEGGLLGIMGMTGTATGIHVHWETVVGGVQIDPQIWLNQHGASPAGGGSTPISLSLGRKKMLLTHSTDGSGWLVTEDGFAGMPNPQVYNLFYRLITSNQMLTPFAGDVKVQTPGAIQGIPMMFNRAEIDIMNAQLRLLALGVNTQQTIDPKKLASALSDALGKTIKAELPPELIKKLDAIQKGVEGIELTPEDFHIEASVSAEELADAFDAAVPRVAAALLKKQGEALTAASAVK